MNSSAKVQDVFVSYAADTKPLAEELTRALEQAGMHTWVDFKDLVPGQAWQSELERALDRADSILVLVSPNSRATPRQEAEWSTVLAKVWSDTGKRLIPVVVGDDEAPPFLRRYVPVRIDPETNPSAWIEQVVRTLQAPPPPLRDLSKEDVQVREYRLDQIARAAEQLRDPNAAGSVNDPKP